MGIINRDLIPGPKSKNFMSNAYYYYSILVSPYYSIRIDTTQIHIWNSRIMIAEMKGRWRTIPATEMEIGRFSRFDILRINVNGVLITKIK